MDEINSAVRDFINEFWHKPGPANADADVFVHFGIEGDDASEFIDHFASKFGVAGGVVTQLEGAVERIIRTSR